MTNPTIFVTLDSLQPGTAPSVTESIEVAEGAHLDFNVTWPESASNSITGNLQFTGNDQDPFNDEINGTTPLSFNRANSTSSATETLIIKTDASLTTDTYTLTLSIDGTNYSTDPQIIVDED